MNRNESPRRLAQPFQEAQDLRLHRDVERRDRLVGDEQLGVEHQRARDADALALAAGEFVRIAVECIARQADLGEQLSRAPRRSRRDAHAVDAQRLGRASGATVRRGLSDE